MSLRRSLFAYFPYRSCLYLAGFGAIDVATHWLDTLQPFDKHFLIPFNALCSLLLPFMALLLFHTYAHERRRSRTQTSDVSRHWSLFDIGLAALAATAIDFGLWWHLNLSHALPPYRTALRSLLIDSQIPSITLVLLASVVDHALKRKMLATFWAVLCLIHFNVAFLGVRLLYGPPPSDPGTWYGPIQLFFKDFGGQLLLIWGAAFACTAIIYVLYLLWSGMQYSLPYAPSSTKELQFRFIKAFATFSLPSVVLVTATWFALNSLQVIPPSLFIAADMSRADPVATVIAHQATVGLAWVLSMPWIVLLSMIAGLLIVQDFTRIQWIAKKPLWSTSTIDWIVTAARQMRDDLGLVTAAITTTMQTSPTQIFIGGALNIGFSLSAVFYSVNGYLAFWNLDESDPVHGLTIINFWAGSALIWAVPFVSSITNLHATLQSGLSLQVSRSLSRAGGHMVVAGYGDLARRVIRGLFHTALLRVDRYLDSSDAYLPTGERVVLLQDLVCVDKEEEAFETVVRLAHGTLGLIRVESDTLNETTCAIGILGDVNDRQVLQTARVAYSGNFLCLARDETAAYTGTDIIDGNQQGRPVNAIISVPSTANLALFSYRSIGSVFAQLHSGQVRAMAVAQAVASTLSKARPGATIRVLLIGAGSELTYIIDSILRCVRNTVRGIAQLSFGILSDDTDFRSRVLLVDDGNALPGWSSMHFSPHCTVRDECNIVPHHVQLLTRDPRIESVVSAALESFQADVIVLSDPALTRQMRIVKTAIRAIRYTQATRRATRWPTLILGAETGRPGRTVNLGDASLYYSTIAEFGSRAGYLYPRQYGRADHVDRVLIGDLLVDVLDDPSQKICGIVHAHKNADPFEVALCLRGRPGALAHVMCQSSGFRFVSDDADSGRFHSGVPSLNNSRMYLDRGGDFFIHSSARLQNVRLSEDVPPIKRGVFFPNADEGNASKAWKERFAERTGTPKKEWLTEGCPEMTGCPVASFLSQLSALSESRVPHVNECCIATRGNDLYTPSQDQGYEARLVAIAEHGQTPGVLARVLSALVFRRIRADERPGRRVLNVTYCSDSPCHNKSYSIVTIHGNVVDLPSPDGSMFPLKALLVRPTRGQIEWGFYMLELCTFVSDITNAQWNVDVLVIDQERMSVLCLYPGEVPESPLERVCKERGCRAQCPGETLCRLCQELHAAIDGIDLSRISVRQLTREMLGGSRRVGV